MTHLSVPGLIIYDMFFKDTHLYVPVRSCNITPVEKSF
jgi:hypothetical protein